MKKLFDASAIIVLIKNHPTETVTILKDQHILDLTIYELGNATWKINKLLKKPDKKTAIETIKQLQKLIALMKIHPLNDTNAQTAVMENAFQYNLTYYDSAYLTIAKQRKYTLVTMDKRLQKAADTSKTSNVKIDEILNN